MTGAKLYIGEIVDYQGTSPGPAQTYIVRWIEGIDPKQLNGVRPAYWKWDALGVDEDGAKTVSDRTTVLVIHQADTYAFHFVPAPLVGQCTGTGTESLVPLLLQRLADLEARVAAMESA